MVAGTALKAAGSLYSNFKASEASRAADYLQMKRLGENEAWYQKKMGEDYLSRTDAQRSLNEAKEQARKSVNRVKGSAAVTGATDESVALAKQGANDMVGNVAAELGSEGSRAKDRAEERYLNQKDVMVQEQQRGLREKANNISQAGSNTNNTASSIISAASSIGSSDGKAPASSGSLFSAFKADKSNSSS
jgi:hypothetical protein